MLVQSTTMLSPRLLGRLMLVAGGAAWNGTTRSAYSLLAKNPASPTKSNVWPRSERPQGEGGREGDAIFSHRKTFLGLDHMRCFHRKTILTFCSGSPSPFLAKFSLLECAFQIPVRRLDGFGVEQHWRRRRVPPGRRGPRPAQEGQGEAEGNDGAGVEERPQQKVSDRGLATPCLSRIPFGRTYEVARQHGTERAFTGQLTDNKAAGDYLCSSCSAQLFSSDAKFDSGSGWPSFYQAAAADNVEEKRDVSFGMVRTEVLCRSVEALVGVGIRMVLFPHQAMRRPPGSRVQRRPPAHRTAILHQQRLTQVQQGRIQQVTRGRLARWAWRRDKVAFSS